MPGELRPLPLLPRNPAFRATESPALTDNDVSHEAGVGASPPVLAHATKGDQGTPWGVREDEVNNVREEEHIKRLSSSLRMVARLGAGHLGAAVIGWMWVDRAGGRCWGGGWGRVGAGMGKWEKGGKFEDER
jgi:hypothetical protein